MSDTPEPTGDVYNARVTPPHCECGHGISHHVDGENYCQRCSCMGYRAQKEEYRPRFNPQILHLAEEDRARFDRMIRLLQDLRDKTFDGERDD